MREAIANASKTIDVNPLLGGTANITGGAIDLNGTTHAVVTATANATTAANDPMNLVPFAAAGIIAGGLILVYLNRKKAPAKETGRAPTSIAALRAKEQAELATKEQPALPEPKEEKKEEPRPEDKAEETVEKPAMDPFAKPPEQHKPQGTPEPATDPLKEPPRPKATIRPPPPPGLRKPETKKAKPAKSDEAERKGISPVLILGVLLVLLAAFILGPSLMNPQPKVSPTPIPTPTPIVVTVTVTVPAIINGSGTITNGSASATPTVPPSPTPMVTPYPTLSPTATPDRYLSESVLPLDIVDYDRVVNPEISLNSGLLTIGGLSYYGSAYAYRGDTFYMKIVYQDNNASVNQVRVRYSVMSEDLKTTLVDSDRVEYWRLEPGDAIARTYGFRVDANVTSGVYVNRLSVYRYNMSTGKYDDYCASMIRKLTVL